MQFPALLLVTWLAGTVPSLGANDPASPGAAATMKGSGAGDVAWCSLEFESHQGPLRASLVVERHPGSVLGNPMRPPACAAGRGAPPTDELVATSHVSFSGTRVTTSWVRADVGLVQSEDVKAERRSLHGYAACGYRSERSRMRGDAATREPQVWEGEWKTPPCGPIVDASTLLWLLGARGLGAEGARLEMVLPTHSGPVRVVAHAEGMAADASGRAARRVMVEPAGEEDQDADGGRIEILGIRGALEVLIQPGTGVPLEISGDVKAAGHVTAHLEKWAPCAP